MDNIFYQDVPIEEMVNTLSKEIPNNNSNIGEVITMIEELDNGNEPVLLKIVSGTATSDEIKEWAQINDIPLESVDEVLNMLVSSYSIGADIAKNINEDILEQNEEIKTIRVNCNNEEIVEKLDNILESLNKIRSEVYELIKQLGK